MIDVVKLDLGFKINTGAPNPIVLSSEYKTTLVFYIAKYNIKNISFPMERNREDDKSVAVFQFNFCHRIYFGDPSQDEIGFHRYAKLGLSSYNCYELKKSDWINEVNNRAPDSIIPIAPLQHLLFFFHDSTFECLCRGYEFKVENLTIKEAVEKYSSKCYE